MPEEAEKKETKLGHQRVCPIFFQTFFTIHGTKMPDESQKAKMVAGGGPVQFFLNFSQYMGQKYQRVCAIFFQKFFRIHGTKMPDESQKAKMPAEGPVQFFKKNVHNTWDKNAR